jgi:hypothetical protein
MIDEEVQKSRWMTHGQHSNTISLLFPLRKGKQAADTLYA